MRVLVVDDNAELRRTLCRVLREFGFSVVAEASDGGEALQRIRRVQPQVLITDCQMPNMDGIRLTRVLRASGMTLPIIMVSAANDQLIAKAAIEAGVDKFLAKPVEYWELRESLRQVLGRLPTAA